MYFLVIAGKSGGVIPQDACKVGVIVQPRGKGRHRNKFLELFGQEVHDSFFLHACLKGGS